MPGTINFSERSNGERELMDDFAVSGDELREALVWLTYVNKWLGGYQASISALRPLLNSSGDVSILDVGTGIADYPAEFVEIGERHGSPPTVRAIDANPHALSFADSYLDERLPDSLRTKITLQEADATDLPFVTDSFDVVHCALFMHHFEDFAAVALLREFQRIARLGVIINDLHRHRMAYYGVKTIGSVARAPRMFRHDGPLSVRRGFTYEELDRLATQAGLDAHEIAWKWAFRWLLSSFHGGRSYA